MSERRDDARRREDNAVDAALVASARRGDQDAFAQLFRRHWPAVVGAARRVLRDHDLAQDAAQEAFLRAHRALGRIADGANVLSWLLRVARNIAVDHLRALRVLPMRELTAAEEPVSRVSEAPPARACVRDEAPLWSTLRDLPQRDRQLLLMRYGRGLSYEQIVRESGLPLGVVKISLHRGRARLQRRCG